MTKLYVIIQVESLEDIPVSMQPYYSIDPIGVYSDLETALNYIETLQEKSDKQETRKGKEEPTYMYDMMEMYLDEKPFLLDFLEKQEQLTEDVIAKVLTSLVKKGLVEQLIGEDGYFYFQLTESGQAAKDTLPANIVKFFKRKRL